MSQKEYSITGPLGGAVPGVVNMSVDAVSGSVRASTMTEDGGVIINQKTQVDLLSSSETNLAVGAFFTGPAIPDINWTAVQYSLKTDQNCIIYIDQSPDGINWDIEDSYNVFANVGGGNTAQLVSSYYRFRVQNIGFATTTYFRLQVIQIPFLNPLPRSLNQDGHLEVSQYGFQDHYGTQQYIAPNGELVAIPIYKLVGDSFSVPSLDSNMWTAVTGTGGTVDTNLGQLRLITGTTANNSVSLTSVNLARFSGAAPNKARIVIQLPDTGTVNNLREWGVKNGTDGAFFQLNGTTFNAILRKAGVDTVIASGSFNGQYGATFAPGLNAHFYEIIYQPRQVIFMADNKIIHTHSASASMWTTNLHMGIYYENTNSGGSTTNVSMFARLGVIVRFGIAETQKNSIFQQGTTAGRTVKIGAGNIHGVILSGITNNSVVTLYDNTTATGTVIWSSGPLTPNGLPFGVDMKGITFSNGLTLAITAANANCLVMYE